MTHTWTFSDGTIADWTEDAEMDVRGDAALAESIRAEVRAVAEGGTKIWPATQPSGAVNLDLSNIWMVDFMLKNEAARFRVALVCSTYTRRDEDMTPEVAVLVMRDRNRGPGVPGRVY